MCNLTLIVVCLLPPLGHLSKYNKCKLIVPFNQYKSSKAPPTTADQSFMTDYLDQITKDQRALTELIASNKLLREELLKAKCGPILEPSFLQGMYRHAISNQSKSKNAFRFDDHMKSVALYMYAVSGRAAYETFHANLPGSLPHVATVARALSEIEGLVEGKFRFCEIKASMIARGEELVVHVFRDDTKITERLRYCSASNEVFGLKLPLDEDGKPICGSFEFTTFAAVQKYISEHPMSSYAKLMTVRSLTPNSSIHVIVIYGTRGSDTSEDVFARLKFVVEQFKSIGVEVICKYLSSFVVSHFKIPSAFAADGASAFAKTMQHIMNIPPTPGSPTNCPEAFTKYFFGNWDPTFLCFQDYKHVIVKFFRAIMNKSLKIGTGLASRSCLLQFLEHVGKPIVGVSKSQLINDKDRMDYEIAAKVCHPRFISELKGPSEQGTKWYLELMRDTGVAFISTTTEPRERIFYAWRVNFSIRMWNQLLSEKQPKTQDESEFRPTVKNFISPNLGTCVEINGQGLLVLHNKCRDRNRPDLFVPSELNSQQCESTFRTYRSLTGVRSTIVSMDMMEILQRYKKFSFIENASLQIKDFHQSQSEKRDQLFVPQQLVTDDELGLVLQEGFESARQNFKQFSKLLCLKFRYLNNQAFVCLDPLITNENDPPKMMLAPQSRWSPSIKLEPDSDDEENDEVMDDQDEQDDALIESEIEPDFMLNNMQRALRSKTKLVELHDEGAEYFGRQPVYHFQDGRLRCECEKGDPPLVAHR